MAESMSGTSPRCTPTTLNASDLQTSPLPSPTSQNPPAGGGDEGNDDIVALSASVASK
uniref:Uncharacterized protein n=1 Tax=Triticum urartu TaxID=4572 RepID=A0A8R7Q957_TRIUA